MSPMGVDKAVNDRIRQVRQALNLSQAKFSRGIHLKSTGYCCDIEQARVEANPRIIELIASIYGVSKQWILTGEGRMFDQKPDQSLEEMTIYFNQLNPEFKRYVLTQIKNLLRLQSGDFASGPAD